MDASLTIDADLDQLAVVRRFISQYTQAYCTSEMNADEAYLYELTLAIDEVVTNIIEHGYQGESGKIHLALKKRNGDLEVVLRDAAPPFDPTQVPTPNVNLAIDQRDPGGLGVFLARKLTDRMVYRRLPKGGNELRLLKRCPENPNKV